VKAGTKGLASTEVQASPTDLYYAVSDVRRMGEWSPECRSCEWIDGAVGPTVGAKFKGRNRRGPLQWSTQPRVVVADPGHEFAFVTGHRGRDLTKWTYRFDPVIGGTKVEESFEMLNDMPWYFRLADRYLVGIKDRRSDLVSNMARTLQQLKAAIEHHERSH
jgi:Polyketide cyclase / dehydrase and lipid transport